MRNCDPRLFYSEGQKNKKTTNTQPRIQRIPLQWVCYCDCFIKQSMQMLHGPLVSKGLLSGELITDAANHSCKIQRGR